MTNIVLWERRPLYEGKHISLMWQDVTKDWKTFQYEVVVRNKINWIVGVLPVTVDGKIILIKQYRIPQESYVLEAPAWLCDKDWESKIDAAKRELLEETWYSSDNLVFAYTAASSAWLTSERVDCYIALNCKKISEILDLDSSEDIEVIEVSLEEIDEFILVQIANGMIVDSKLIALLYFYRNMKNNY